MVPWEAKSENPFRFKGRLIPYKNQRTVSRWGGFYVDNSARSGRLRRLNPGPCQFCRLAFNSPPDVPAMQVSLGGEKYILLRNINPIIENQLLLFPLPTANDLRFLEHREDVSKTDVQVIAELITGGFKNLKCSRYKKHEWLARPDRELEGSLYRKPWAAYVNAFARAGRSVRHLHINCLPAAHIPILDVAPQPWQVCRDEATGATVSRFADMSFYGLMVEAENADALAQTVARLHQELNEWETPYNLLAYPAGAGQAGVRVAIIPRDQEYCEAADQRIAGLEFLTGILIPGASRLHSMDTIQRDLAFQQATLKPEQRLTLERRLRRAFGMPPAGCAVYPVPVPGAQTKRLKYKPAVLANNVFTDHPQAGYWVWPQPDANPAFERLRIEPNVLVRVVRASICQSDRRVLKGDKPSTFQDEAYVLGHEAGGYVVDPGPWHRELMAGQKAVILPHLTCGQPDCEYCPRYQQNLCPRMRHLGFHLNGNMAELMSFPYQCIRPVPPTFPTDALPLVEPLACVLRALFRIKSALSDLPINRHPRGSAVNSFTVYGSGPMGCLAARAVKRFWPHVTVTMVEPLAPRRGVIEESRVADRVVGQFPDNHKHLVSFVASSRLQASFDAIKNTEFGGTVVLFSGVNEGDLKRDRRQRHTPGSNLERIHRLEMAVKEYDPVTQRAYRLVGSSGYNFDDAARSVHELARHYAHYVNLQNVVIDGLQSETAYYCRPIDDTTALIQEHPRRDPRPVTFAGNVRAVETLLAPAGVYDKVYGADIARMIKVLIRL